MNHLDLFSGIGGFALAAERAWLVRDQSVLPLGTVLALAAPSGDIGRIDVLTAGYPCQPFSTAARGRNVARDWWPTTLAIIRRVRPSWVVLENVPGRRLEHVERSCSDLERGGYAVWPFDIAVEIRKHVRRRLWVVAHANSEGEPQCAVDAQMAGLREITTRRWREPEPVGMDDGVPARMDRMRALGNSIEPQIAELIFRGIAASVAPSDSGVKP